MHESRASCAVILMGEDDPDDALLAREALEECRMPGELKVVRDGQAFLDYLYHRGEFADPEGAPMPGLMLLDLNMPRVDGWQVLEAIGQDPVLRRIPRVVMTTSSAREDVQRSYDLGASGYIRKPSSFDGLVDVMRTLGEYWFQVVSRPYE